MSYTKTHSYLCIMILNYPNYGTKQETIKQQAKARRGSIKRWYWQ